MNNFSVLLTANPSQLKLKNLTRDRNSREVSVDEPSNLTHLTADMGSPDVERGEMVNRRSSF